MGSGGVIRKVSGHLSPAITFGLILGELWGWWVADTAAIVLVLLIGFFRLYLDVHYPGDGVAGYLAVTLWVATVRIAFAHWRSLLNVRGVG